MTFSEIAVEQRSKEADAIKSFLIYSLIGSLTLHIGVLSSGIGNILTRSPDSEAEPLEFTVVDSPAVEPEKPLEKIPEEPKQEPEIVQKQPIVTAPIEKLVETPKTTPVQQQSPNIIAVPEKPQPTNTPPRETATRLEAPVKSTPVTPTNNQSSSNLREQLSGLRGSRASESGGDRLTPLTSSDVSSNLREQLSGLRGSRTSESGGDRLTPLTSSDVSSNLREQLSGLRGSRTGESGGDRLTPLNSSSVNVSPGTRTGIIRGEPAVNQSANNSTVAAAPTPPKINRSSGNSRVTCRSNCDFKYPTSLRGKVEGSPRFKVDTDDKGNVTNIRLERSSGNRELDEHALREVSRVKTTPINGGRQGVSIVPNYVIRGTERQRQAQKRKEQREAQQRREQQAAANNTSSTEETSTRKLQPLTSTIRDVPAETTNRPKIPRRTIPTSEGTATRTIQPRSSNQQRSLRNSLNQTRRKPVARDSSSSSQPTRTQQGRTRQGTSSSQSKLRNALLRSRQPSQPSQSTPPVTPSSTGE